MTGSLRLLLLSPLALVLGCFALTVTWLLVASFGSFDVYIDLLSSKSTQNVILRTLYISAITAVGCLVLSYPLALFLASSKNRNLWLIVIISPWLVSIVVRTFGWMVLLGNRGIINNALMSLGITDAPIGFLYTPLAVSLGLIHIFIPYMTIILLASLIQTDRSLVEAAQILGASRWTAFFKVVFQLSMPAALTGLSLVMLLGCGAIVTPLLLGGVRDRMLGTDIYMYMFQMYNFEKATALAVILVVISFLVVLPLQFVEARIAARNGQR